MIKVAEPTDAAEARRVAVRMAEGLGFDEMQSGKLAIIVTEAATNLLRHGGGGEVIVRSILDRGTPGIEVLAFDKGKGMENVAACTQDGYSTANGSQGTGLGAIGRLSTSSTVYSVPGQGTIVRALCNLREPSEPGELVKIAMLSTPKPGEKVCGDTCGSRPRKFGATIMIADGLGHGILAGDASRAAVAVLYEMPEASPAGLLERMHVALRGTRGAAVGIAEIDCKDNVVRFAGVGNITGVVMGEGASRHLVSMNGIVGHETKRIRQFEVPIRKGDVVILHSDGIDTKWDLSRYPGVIHRPPSVLAVALLRDSRRMNDDASVGVAQVA